MKLSLKRGWIGGLALTAAVITVAFLTPSKVSATTCDDGQCVYDNACYGGGACSPSAQECDGSGFWMSVKDSQGQCQLQN